MGKTKFKSLIVSAALCIGMLLVPLGSTDIMLGATIPTPDIPYKIRGTHYTDAEGTVWFNRSETAEILAPDNYTIGARLDVAFDSQLSYTYGNYTMGEIPTSVYLQNNEGVTDPIPLKLKWDITNPTCEVALGNRVHWNALVKKISFDTIVERSSSEAYFSIVCNDGESGLNKVEYYVADTDLLENESLSAVEVEEKLETEINGQWIISDGSNIPLGNNKTNVIYVKFADNVGNVWYLNSSGIVLFEQPSVSTTSIAYTKEGITDPTFEVSLNGNMFDGDIVLKDASGNTIVDFTQREDESDTSWGYHNADGLITLNREFLDSLYVEGTEATYTMIIDYVQLAEQYPDIQNSNIEIVPTTINLAISNPPVDISHWGTEVSRQDNVVQYVDNVGKTSVEVSAANLYNNGVLWLSENSNGMNTWYGIDLSQNTFDLDETSRFYVQWLSDSETDYTQLYNQLDENIQNNIEENNNWIFRIGVEDVDGAKLQPGSGKVKVYIQLADDWDKEDVKAYAIMAGEDTAISVDFVENANYPNGSDNFAVLELSHFSPYIIYEEKEVVNTPPVDNNKPQTPPTNNDNQTDNPIQYYPLYNEPIENDTTITSPKTGDNGLGLEMCLSIGILLLFYYIKTSIIGIFRVK